MNEFFVYLSLGFEHITDPGGYDHILFVIALCAVYTLRQWRAVLILVTAFTVGHSITLALATLRIINYSTDVIELLIPITILITTAVNVVKPAAGARHYVPKAGSANTFRYVLALLFGLIHGMGFSNYLRSLLGREADIVQPLLAFNVGLELGQLAIVGVVLALAHIAVGRLRVSARDWSLVVSGVVAGMALSLILGNEYLAQLLSGEPAT